MPLQARRALAVALLLKPVMSPQASSGQEIQPEVRSHAFLKPLVSVLRHWQPREDEASFLLPALLQSRAPISAAFIFSALRASWETCASLGP